MDHSFVQELAFIGICLGGIGLMIALGLATLKDFDDWNDGNGPYQYA